MYQKSVDVFILKRMRHYEDKIAEQMYKANGLNTSCSLYLMLLAENPSGLTLKEITEYFDNDKANTTRVIGMLLFKGLVTKADLSIRKYRVKATERGRAAAEKAQKAFLDLRDTILAPLTDQEKETMLSLLAKIIDASPYGW